MYYILTAMISMIAGIGIEYFLTKKCIKKLIDESLDIINNLADENQRLRTKIIKKDLEYYALRGMYNDLKGQYDDMYRICFDEEPEQK